MANLIVSSECCQDIPGHLIYSMPIGNEIRTFALKEILEPYKVSIVTTVVTPTETFLLEASL